MLSQFGCFSPLLLGEERFIRAAARIMLSSPLMWLRRKEAVDIVFKERRSSHRDIAEAYACMHTAIKLLGDLARLVVLTINWR